MMDGETPIPTTPLKVAFTSHGFWPDIALHQRGSRWHHESSYLHFWSFGAICALAVIVCFIPWDARSFFRIPVRFIIAGGLLWGGICGLAPMFIRNRIGQRIILDVAARTVTIEQRDTSNVVSSVISNPASLLTIVPPALPTVTIDFGDVLGIQLAGFGPYQANLVFNSGDKTIRHNLVNHSGRSIPMSLASSYVAAGGFPLIDHT